MFDCDVKEIIKKLSWNFPENIQQEAIDNIVNLCIKENINLYDFFMETDKSSWLNYCKVVEVIGNPKNVTAIPALLILLQDTNWPGSMEALSLLMKAKKEDLIPCVEKAILTAFDEKDFIWLIGIKTLADNLGLKESEFVERSTFQLLDFADY